MKVLISRIKKKYPHLISRMQISEDKQKTSVNILFSNQRYSLWFEDEQPWEKGTYVVGINFLHSHFDSEDEQANREEAWEYIEDILNDEVVAIGNKKKTEDYIIATMPKEEGLKKYKATDERLEIVSFNKQY